MFSITDLKNNLDQILFKLINGSSLSTPLFLDQNELDLLKWALENDYLFPVSKDFFLMALDNLPEDDAARSNVLRGALRQGIVNMVTQDLYERFQA